MNLKIKALLIIYGLQTVASCCPDVKEYEVTYHGMIVKSINYKTNQIIDPTTTIYKSDFELFIDLLKQEKQIANNFIDNSLSALSFNSAYAISCIEDKYIYINPPKTLQILATNVDTNEITDVTQNFMYYGTPAKGIFNYKGVDEFHFGIVNEENIPKKVTFQVKITLESGDEFKKETDIIQFY